MKTLHRYLTQQVLASLVMTVLVFTFVLLLGNVLKEILSLLVNRQATLPLVLHAIGLLIPYVLAFAMPLGLLTATLLVFGRFSADQELTAARAGGMSLLTLISPILLLSLALCGLCAWINLDLAPRCRIAYKRLLFQVGTTEPMNWLRENQYVSDIPGGFTIYIGKREGDLLKDIQVYQTHEKDHSYEWYKAAQGRLVYDAPRQTIRLTLLDAYGAVVRGSEIQPVSAGETQFELPIKPPEKQDFEPSLSNMTFSQLRAKLRELETHGMTDPTPVLVQLHRQIAFSFACISFTLIGIPLGIRAHRRETSVGIALALILLLVYYSFIILGESLETRSDLAPHLIVWLPNFLFQALGGVLLWRANRGV